MLTNLLKDVHVASFFSIYRPMSVTASVPPTSSPDAFSSIFAPQQKPRTADVIYTLSSAVNALEGTTAQGHVPKHQHSISQQSQNPTPEEVDLRTAVTQASNSNAETTNPTYLDGQASPSIQINIQELAKSFRPFVPPPPPVPMGSEAEHKREVAATQQHPTASAPKQKSYSTVLTILENTHADGRKTYETRTSPIREGPAPTSPQQEGVSEAPTPHRQPFLERMRIRQERWDESREEARNSVWRAISVKRQRKLKMKKHKYKKLMRRTRNLRRKLDRL